MTPLLDTNRKQWGEAAADFGEGVEFAQLLTPLTRFAWYGGPFAVENGLYSGAEMDAFLSLLERQRPHREQCIFVSVPDVPFSARRTREVFNYWYPKLCVWPLAYVSQNGQEDIDIPWPLVSAVFIGGDDAHKDGREGECVARAAMAMGKHVHWGRVNNAKRVRNILRICRDYPKLTCDGSGMSQYREQRIDVGRAIRGDKGPDLFTKEDEHDAENLRGARSGNHGVAIRQDANGSGRPDRVAS
jgi:hypothetical protein